MPLDPAKIKARREKLGLSQQQAADRAAMPQSNWSRIERGARADPSLSIAERVAKALEYPLPKLLAD